MNCFISVYWSDESISSYPSLLLLNVLFSPISSYSTFTKIWSTFLSIVNRSRQLLYSSIKISTQITSSKDTTYGYYTVRLKVPKRNVSSVSPVPYFYYLSIRSQYTVHGISTYVTSFGPRLVDWTTSLSEFTLHFSHIEWSTSPVPGSYYRSHLYHRTPCVTN